MKLFIVLSICSALLLLSGCNRNNAQKEEGESPAESTNKSNLIEMGVSAQQHIGMVVAPATLKQLNEYLRTTGTVQPIDSKVGVVGPLARGRIVKSASRLGTGSKGDKRLRFLTTSKPVNSSHKSNRRAPISNVSKLN